MLSNISLLFLVMRPERDRARTLMNIKPTSPVRTILSPAEKADENVKVAWTRCLPNIFSFFYTWKQKMKKSRSADKEWRQKVTSPNSLMAIYNGFKERNFILEESFLMEQTGK